ncbi:MAG: damage-inducible protein D [Acidobacteria bacterium]|nr:MAG: damage-inducible protein D [Acidobacteriota bacterium]
MADSIALFEPDGTAFEGRGQPNGGTYWYASEFMAMLGYESYAAFEQAINRAIGTCTTLSIPVVENFQQVDVEGVRDYRLSRFACYLIAMNGDVRKPAVAAAQAYFATLAEAARQYMQASHDVERVQIRDEISERDKSLMSTAKKAGVGDFALFHNAGYRGMYNMHLGRLKAAKGVPEGRTLLDFMDKRELAGNLFRFTETEARLRSDQVYGQAPAETVAFQVGKQVRKIMIDSDCTPPERIPLTSDIKDVRKNLKQTAKEFTKLDKPAGKRKRLPPAE